jgi:hypothetical protein
MLGFDNSIIPFMAPRSRPGRRRRATRVQAGGGHCGRRLLGGCAGVHPGRRMAGGHARPRCIRARRRGDVAGAAGIAVARIATGASRSVLAMSSEFYSRGITETWVTTGVFVIAIALGVRDVAPALAVALGTTAAAVVAYALAARAIEARVLTGTRGGRLQLDRLRRFQRPARCCAFRCRSPARAC